MENRRCGHDAYVFVCKYACIPLLHAYKHTNTRTRAHTHTGVHKHFKRSGGGYSRSPGSGQRCAAWTGDRAGGGRSRGRANRCWRCCRQAKDVMGECVGVECGEVCGWVGYIAARKIMLRVSVWVVSVSEVRCVGLLQCSGVGSGVVVEGGGKMVLGYSSWRLGFRSL